MKITRDELLIAAFKLFMSVNYKKVSIQIVPPQKGKDR